MNFINKPYKSLSRDTGENGLAEISNSIPRTDEKRLINDDGIDNEVITESNQVVPTELATNEEGLRSNKVIDLLLLTLVITTFISSLGISIYLFLISGVLAIPEPVLAEARNSSSTMIRDEREIYQFYDGSISENDIDTVEASSFIGFNPVTYQIYASSNVESKRSIASITKLMSALVGVDHFKPNELLLVKDLSDTRLEWLLGLKEGDLITYDDLLKSMLINSYNDAAYVVAQNHPEGEDAFIREMNKIALMLGMSTTNFENPSGLDHPENYSTAQDVKKLALLALRTPQIMEIVKTQSDNVTIYRPKSLAADETSLGKNDNYPSKGGFITIDELELQAYDQIEVTLKTTNELLDQNSGMLGLKTGYTSDAGPSFVGYLYGSEQDQLVTIILDAQGDRFEETNDLIELIRTNY